jgi:hypothetical protein
MKFLIHVIDDASQHEPDAEGKYSLVAGESPRGKICDVVRSDVFYIIEAEDMSEAVASVASKIQVKTIGGESVPLSESLAQTVNESNVRDFSVNDDRSTVCDSDLEIETFPYEQSFSAKCLIPQASETEKWIELHKVQFFVVNEKNLIELS